MRVSDHFPRAECSSGPRDDDSASEESSGTRPACCRSAGDVTLF